MEFLRDLIQFLEEKNSREFRGMSLLAVIDREDLEGKKCCFKLIDFESLLNF